MTEKKRCAGKIIFIWFDSSLISVFEEKRVEKRQKREGEIERKLCNVSPRQLINSIFHSHCNKYINI